MYKGKEIALIIENIGGINMVQFDFNAMIMNNMSKQEIMAIVENSVDAVIAEHEAIESAKSAYTRAKENIANDDYGIDDIAILQERLGVRANDIATARAYKASTTAENDAKSKKDSKLPEPKVMSMDEFEDFIKSILEDAAEETKYNSKSKANPNNLNISRILF